jgi:ATP-dependent RNA helicase DeaD
MSFQELGLNDTLVRTLTSLGYEAPTPIQERTIPLLLEGRDVLGQAQTGTGKTAAFALPILQKIDPKKHETQALVLTPTRELAMQVAEAIHSYAAGMSGVSVLPVYGGAPIVHQLKMLQRGVQIVVGTPGRLIDHLDRRSLNLDRIRVIVLDEADEMLKMGFIDDVERILGAAPPSRQVALFSATIPPEIARIAQKYLANAARVEIEHKAINAPAIEQRFLNLAEAQKLDALTMLLEAEENDAVLVFRRTKNGAAELADRLIARGFAAEAMHGDMNQRERERTIKRLRDGKIELVVATDVAARGLDVEQITHVVNYDIPYDVEAYVHRIGRTGRAGRSGIATLFITPRERGMMRAIERYTGSPMRPMKIPTKADVAQKRVAALKETIRKNAADDLDLYLQLVEELVEEGPYDIAEIAAAAAKTVALLPAARAKEETPVEEKAQSTRLQMSIGRRDGIRPADVVGSIANEAGLRGADIGPIEILDDITYVSVPAASAEHVIARVAGAKFKGKPVNLRVASSSPPARPSGGRGGPLRSERFQRRQRPPAKPKRH